jgi:cell division septation protein DedD
VLLSVLSLALVLGLMPTLAAQAACPGNVAVNPSFEDGFTERGAGQVKIANGWQPFWQEGPGQQDGYNRRPEYGPEDGQRYGYKRIHDGNWGQKWFTTYATHRAGVFQQIGVPAGSVVTASAWGQAWSSTEDDPNRSKDGQYSLGIGIDPTGGTDFNSPNVVWTKSGTMDQWVELRAQATAAGGQITVYLLGEAAFRLKHNDAYFDDVCVTYTAPTARPTARPQATAVPAATATPEPSPTPEPTATPEPTEAPESSPTPEASPTPVQSIISVYAFDDANASGLRDANEPLLAGSRIEIQTLDRAPVASYVTTGANEPYAFPNLTPGSYVVIQHPPEGYVTTGSNQWAVVLAEGATVEVFFGSRVVPTVTKAPPTETPVPVAVVVTATPAPPAKRTLADSVSGVSGILVAMLALILPLVYRLLRQQS